MTHFKLHLAPLASAALLLALSTACGQGKSTDAAADSDTTTATEQEVEQFTSYDLSWKDLTGNVESMTITSIPADAPEDISTDSIRFDTEGRISAIYIFYTLYGKRHLSEGAEFSYSDDDQNLSAKKINGAEHSISIERDGYDRIISYSTKNEQIDYSDTSYEEIYNWNDDGRIHSSEINGWEVQAHTIYHYGDNGELIKSVTTSSEPGYESTATLSYTYIKRDNRGNWIERTVDCSTEATEEGHTQVFTSQSTERRYIRYRQ